MAHKMRERAQSICWPAAGLVPMATLACILATRSASIAQEPNSNAPLHHALGESLWLGSNAPLVDVSRSWRSLRGLSLTGYFQTTSGMWANSSALTNFGRSSGEHHGANSLAVERNLLQLDCNYFLDGDNSWFVRFWGVYEPPYPWEAHNIAGPNLAYDKSQSDFYNRYDIPD